MSKPSKVSKWSSLAVLFEAVAQLESDHQTPLATLHERDRAIGKQISSRRLDRSHYRKISAWLQARLLQISPRCGERVRSAERGVAFILGILGFACGISAAGAVFMYDGTRPVNVLSVLLVFVALPLFFLCVTVLALLPNWFLKMVPGIEGLVDAVAMFAPGRLYAKLVILLPQKTRSEISLLLASAKRRHAVFGELEKLLTISATQFFALGFFIGSLLYALCLVIFSDVAFAWSTTLVMGADSFHRVVQTLAWPWAALTQDAVPSLSLIEDTRYFRWESASGEPLNRLAIMKFGGWWPFVILCMATYGVLPRLLLAYYAVRKMQRCARETLETYPGVADLLLRLDADPVATQAAEPEHSRLFESVSDLDAGIKPFENSGVCIGIDWSNSGAHALLQSRVFSDDQRAVFILHAAGAGSEISDDDSILRAIVASRSTAPVALFVKAWEPPTEETIDFLKELRKAVGERTPLFVVPLAPFGAAAHTPSSEYLGVWHRRVQRVGDPWIELRIVSTDSPKGAVS